MHLIHDLDHCINHLSDVQKIVNRCRKNRVIITHNQSHMNTRIFRWKPNLGENHCCRHLSLQTLLLRKLLTTCTGADSYQHAGTHLQKATTFSRLLAFPGREQQPPALVYQPLLEGSYYPLILTPSSPGRKLLLSDWRLQPSDPLQTTFHQFSNWIKQLQHNPSLISKRPFPRASNRIVKPL